MRAGCCQFEPVPFDIRSNTETMIQMITGTSLDLIVFPELAFTGYLFDSREQLKRHAMTAESEYITAIQDTVDTESCAVVIGLAEIDIKDGSLYNSAICLRPKKSPLIYRKAHLFGLENEVFDRAESGFFCFEYQGAKIGMLVCFDHYFPEAARSLMLQGAQIICHPSNLVLEGAAQLTTRVRSMENRIFWLLANRCGTQGALTFTGGSQIVSPKGEVLCHAGRDTIEMITAEIDPELATNKHITSYNDIPEDRRVDLYTIS